MRVLIVSLPPSCSHRLAEEKRGTEEEGDGEGGKAVSNIWERKESTDRIKDTVWRMQGKKTR